MKRRIWGLVTRNQSKGHPGSQQPKQIAKRLCDFSESTGYCWLLGRFYIVLWTFDYGQPTSVVYNLITQQSRSLHRVIWCRARSPAHPFIEASRRLLHPLNPSIPILSYRHWSFVLLSGSLIGMVQRGMQSLRRFGVCALLRWLFLSSMTLLVSNAS